MAERADECKPQVSMVGRMAWVIKHLARLRGNGEQDAVRWVIDRWIDGEGREYLASYGIDVADYIPDDPDVLPMPGSEEDTGTG